MSGTAVLLLAFQNCSDFALDEKLVYSQSIFESQVAADSEGIPRLTTSESLVFWSKPGAPSFVVQSPAFFEKGAVIAVFDRTMTGRIIVVQTADAKTEEMAIDIVAGKVRATHYTDPSNYTFQEASLPTSGDKVTVAVRFGTAVTDIAMQLNGVIQDAAVQKFGNPGDFGYVKKTPAVGTTGGGVTEYAIFNEALNDSDLNVMSRYIARELGISYVIYDPGLANGGAGGGTTTTGPTPEFQAASAIIQSNCTTCHNGTQVDFRNWDQAKFVRNGYAKAKNPEGSPIYYRVKGSTGTNGPKTMGNLNATQIQTIANWINSIQ
jgi:hypothetical protein